MKKLGSQLLTISRGLAMCCLLTLRVYRCLATSLPSILTAEGAGLASSCVCAHTMQWISLYKTNPSLLAIVSKGVLVTVCTSAIVLFLC